MDKDQLLQLRKLMETSMERSEEFRPGESKIPLSVPSYGPEEVLEAIDSLVSLRVTMGDKVRRFEALFSEYIGTKHAVMVNSGSSANLVALSVLASAPVDGIKPGDEVITPAVTWSTTVFPIINMGAIPVLVDVDLSGFTIDVDAIRQALTDRTRAILPVHLLGNACDMYQIETIAAEHDLYVVEDACEAHGTEIDGRKVGTFGDLATFSFFFSHHISTIEGGMVMTDNDAYADQARSLRAHGWIRERSDREGIAARFPSLDKRFLFKSLGYNLRPTEIQGAFGIHQINRLERFIRTRRENAEYWANELSKYSECLSLVKTRTRVRHVFFGYPVTVRPEAPFTREELMAFLERRGIETRPIMAGDITQQPALERLPHRVVGSLKNSKIVHTNSFFWGNHHGIGPVERKYVADCVHEFVEEKV